MARNLVLAALLTPLLTPQAASATALQWVDGLGAGLAAYVLYLVLVSCSPRHLSAELRPEVRLMLLVSQVMLWAAVIALAVTVLALARQVGVLHERIAPVGALALGRGPQTGESAPRLTCHVETLLCLEPRDDDFAVGQLCGVVALYDIGDAVPRSVRPEDVVQHRVDRTNVPRLS